MRCVFGRRESEGQKIAAGVLCVCFGQGIRFSWKKQGGDLKWLLAFTNKSSSSLNFEVHKKKGWIIK